MINNSMNQPENKDTPENMNSQHTTPDDNAGINVSGHILIRDAETGEELVNKRNAIHYGNMANTVAQLLANDTSTPYIHYMAFGNGATSVDTAGRVVYKTPRVTEALESGANLYSRTYFKVVSNTSENQQQDQNRIDVIPGVSYTDLKVTCTLGFGEPSGQDIFDSSINNDGDYVFDELALFTYPSDTTKEIDSSNMLTHVIFHPVQKSTNRIIEIVYTVRIQLS